ncbi:hypothetical protein [Pseudalkalibacillus hwajinpoensis]|uniref:hypothetical protein n=1 Tax=Guptibacillus hwajinpoensis TaxID=208199 RepID=UPI001CFCE6CD|nr:hypothetical protein [Pseudalkalibacillus hwajinpoensis]
MFKTKTKFVFLALATVGSLAITIYILFSINERALSANSEWIAPVLVERADYTKEEIDEIASAVSVNPGDENVNAFVASTHAFYNQTTGFGEISSLNHNDQTEKAIEIVSAVNGYLKEEEGDLNQDLHDIKFIALHYIEHGSTGDVQKLHRYFHDLDIGLNRYGAYDKVWGVTAVLGNGE